MLIESHILSLGSQLDGTFDDSPHDRVFAGPGLGTESVSDRRYGEMNVLVTFLNRRE